MKKLRKAYGALREFDLQELIQGILQIIKEEVKDKITGVYKMIKAVETLGVIGVVVSGWVSLT